jgi:hypothetical protein
MTWKNTHTWMNWRSDSSRRNGATLRCRAKNSADLLKTFVDWGLRNKRPEQKKVFPRIHRSASQKFHTLADWLLLYTRFGLSLPEDPWEKLLAFLAILIV